MTIRVARGFAVFIGLLGLFSASRGRAQECPWLNAATAQGLLGGEVTVSVSHPEEKLIVCRFVRQDKPAMELEIQVSSPSSPAEYESHKADCHTQPRALIGVGNEAFACVAKAASVATIEEAAGRVRDQVFVLRWHLPAEVAETEATEKSLQALAEGVAGSLF